MLNNNSELLPVLSELNNKLIQEENDLYEKRKNRIDIYLKYIKTILLLGTVNTQEYNKVYEQYRLADFGYYPTYINIDNLLYHCDKLIFKVEGKTINPPTVILHDEYWGDYFVESFNKITKEFFDVEYDLICDGDDERTLKSNVYLVAENVKPRQVYEFCSYTPCKFENKLALVLMGWFFGLSWIFLFICFVWWVWLHIKFEFTGKMYKDCKSFKNLK